MTVFKVVELKKSYKRDLFASRTLVLKGMTFSVNAGTVTGFLGANGAGKTTTMRCALGLDFADSGRVEFFGEPLNQKNRARIGFLPERPYFYEHLTGVEFLKFYAELNGAWSAKVLKDRIYSLLRRVDLEHAKDRLLRHYSKGMLQKIGLAQALIHDPELVILDEPMSGLDPDGRLALAEIILETARRGPAIFFSSHLLNDTERLCEQLVVMKDGSVIFQGSTEKLLETSQTGVEIVHTDGEYKETIVVADVASAQTAIADLQIRRRTILEVRRLRSSLEEIFVKMALKGGRR